jgi:hypothetical protein
VDYLDVFNQSEDDYDNITVLAGVLECAASIRNTDSYIYMTSRFPCRFASGRCFCRDRICSGWCEANTSPCRGIAILSGFFFILTLTLKYLHPEQFDWEYAQTPAESSVIASSWVCPSFLLRIYIHIIDREITIHMTLMKAGFQTIT